MVRYPWRSAILILLACSVVTGLFMVNLCDLVFDCGCRSLWAGAADHCNIHDATAAHCPWCSVGFSGYMAVYFAIAAPQALLSLYPRRRSWSSRLFTALLTFPVAGALIGLIMGWQMGYWS